MRRGHCHAVSAPSAAVMWMSTASPHLRPHRHRHRHRHLRLLLLAPLLLCLCLLLSHGRGDRAHALKRSSGVRVKQLTDKTFEHDTQASTGQTTGRWAVLFVGLDGDNGEASGAAAATGLDSDEAEGAQQAGKAAQFWSSTDVLRALMHISGQQHPREFIPALVDVSGNPGLRRRFGITRTPQLRLFRDRRMFSWPASSSHAASLDDLQHFLQAGYAEVEAEAVPPVASEWEEILHAVWSKYHEFSQRLAGQPLLLAVFGLGVALMFYAITAQLLGLGTARSSASTASAAGALRRQQQPPRSADAGASGVGAGGGVRRARRVDRTD